MFARSVCLLGESREKVGVSERASEWPFFLLGGREGERTFVAFSDFFEFCVHFRFFLIFCFAFFFSISMCFCTFRYFSFLFVISSLHFLEQGLFFHFFFRTALSASPPLRWTSKSSRFFSPALFVFFSNFRGLHGINCGCLCAMSSLKMSSQKI